MDDSEVVSGNLSEEEVTGPEEENEDESESEIGEEDQEDMDYQFEIIPETSDDEIEKIDDKEQKNEIPKKSPQTRSSSRQRKAPKRFEFDEDKGGDEEELDDEELPPEDSEEGSSRKRSGNTRIRNNFSKEERSNVFKFILNECRSKMPGREGRIAKMRVQTMASRTWEKFKKTYGYKRRTCVYRIHYNFYSKKLHTVPGLTLEERVDLYYAMDIPVTNSKEKQALVEQFGAIIDENDLVVGSTVLTHWDFTHEDEEGGEECDRTRFVEYQDGLMWQFMVDMINNGNDPLSYGPKLWKQFRAAYPAALVTRKTALGYAERSRRITLPNLYIMPFDIEAKAALYQSLEYPVPQEFREKLISETGVTLTDQGFIQDYPNRPAHIVLQSVHYPDSTIGISSTTTISTLREPENRIHVAQDDRNPWTDQEDRIIWDFVKRQARDVDGLLRRIAIPKSADSNFWYRMKQEIGSDRGCHSLFTRFKRLSENIFSSRCLDLEAKLELYYILGKRLDPDAAEAFETIAILIIDNQGVLRFAIGYDFLLGRIEGEDITEEKYSFFFQRLLYNRILGLTEEEPTMSTESFQKLLDRRRIMMYIDALETDEKASYQMMSNSTKFPYVDGYRGIRGKYGKKRGRPPKNSEILEILPVEKEPKMEKLKDLEGEEEDFEKKLKPIDDEVEGPTQNQESCLKRPNDANGPMEKADELFKEMIKNIQKFHRRISVCVDRLPDARRDSCSSDVEQLVRMFRLSGKQALKKRKY